MGRYKFRNGRTGGRTDRRLRGSFVIVSFLSLSISSLLTQSVFYYERRSTLLLLLFHSVSSYCNKSTSTRASSYFFFNTSCLMEEEEEKVIKCMITLFPLELAMARLVPLTLPMESWKPTRLTLLSSPGQEKF